MKQDVAKTYLACNSIIEKWGLKLEEEFRQQMIGFLSGKIQALVKVSEKDYPEAFKDAVETLNSWCFQEVLDEQ